MRVLEALMEALLPAILRRTAMKALAVGGSLPRGTPYMAKTI